MNIVSLLVFLINKIHNMTHVNAIMIPDSKVIGETKVFLNISKKKQTDMGDFLADAISHEVSFSLVKEKYFLDIQVF